MSAAISHETIASVESIPFLNADEARRLMTESFSRLLVLLESLTPEDWSKPTVCTEWNVHDMVSHQAGGYLSGVTLREMVRQYTKLPKNGQLPEDAINAFQVRERKHLTPQNLLDELNQVGKPAIHNWAYGFNAIKWIAIPHPVGGFMSLRYLMWVIHSRDTWMHRMDICRATNRPFVQTRQHDGRIVELVIRDTAKKLKHKLGGRTITLLLTGIAGGKWQIGNGTSIAEIEMDALDFNIFVSGRFSHEEGMKRAKISGDTTLIKTAFKGLLVLY